jgi:sulfate adenylyltransferase
MTLTTGSSTPHGGTLVDRYVQPHAEAELRARAEHAPALTLDPVAEADLTMLACGAFSPLTGFMRKADYDAVISSMHLADGTLWPIPITLPLPANDAHAVKAGAVVALRTVEGDLRGVLTVDEVYERRLADELAAVFRTCDEKHPGVEQLARRPNLIVAGALQALPLAASAIEFPDHHLTPARVRAEAARRGLQSLAGFQTRNPVHRAHEYLIRCALELVDGLLLHPLVGFTKSGDIPASVRMQCYRALLEYLPSARVILSVMPAAMRYAGPREAVLHALVRKNYGCTHFIVGRDHAGVGSYYGSYDAQRIFDDIDPAALGITILRFENSFYCRACGCLATVKTCCHNEDQRLNLSGTQVREKLARGEPLPPEFTRPSIAGILTAHYRQGT